MMTTALHEAHVWQHEHTCPVGGEADVARDRVEIDNDPAILQEHCLCCGCLMGRGQSSYATSFSGKNALATDRTRSQVNPQTDLNPR